MNIMITSIGRRVQLIKHLSKYLNIVGVDCSEVNAGKYFTRKFYKISSFNNKEYIDELLEICKVEGIKLIVPLYELEFLKLLKNKILFENIGVRILLSDEKIISIFNDKRVAHDFLMDNGILTPKVFISNKLKNLNKYPLIVKPRDGMGSRNVFKVNNLKELLFFKKYVHNYMVQEFIDGEEFTVDVLCDFEGHPIYIVPRIRLEVRAGEVSKSKIVKDREIIDLTKSIIGELNKVGDGLKGPLTFQFIKSKESKLYLLELNLRFGGGVPLSLEAGANYSLALKEMLNGEVVNYSEEFKELTMLRYDEAIFY